MCKKALFGFCAAIVGVVVLTYLSVQLFPTEKLAARSIEARSMAQVIFGDDQYGFNGYVADLNGVYILCSSRQELQTGQCVEVKTSQSSYGNGLSLYYIE